MGKTSKASTFRKKTSPIEGWKKEEKFYLLQGLKAYGSHDIDRIQEYISSKTPEEVIKAINYYKEISTQHPVFATPINKSRKQYKPRVPLTSWANLLTDYLPFKELRTETSNAVRMIAEFINLPKPAYIEQIDFRQIYSTLANAMEGKNTEPDKVVISVLNKCIIETALSSKAFIKTSSYKYVINAIDLTDKEALAFPRPTENPELTNLRHLVAQRSYNPFKVPENYLQPSRDLQYDYEPTKLYTDTI